MGDYQAKIEAALAQNNTCTCGDAKGSCLVHESKRLHVAEEPKPDALSPEALREEIVLIIMGMGTGANLARGAAERKADAVIQKLMDFYSAVAVPEVNAPIHVQFDNLQRLQFSTDRALEAGSGMSQTLGDVDPLRTKWQTAAVNLRESVQNVLNMLS